MEKNIIESNKLIAEFMGWEYFKESKCSEEQWGSHSHFEICEVWVLNPTALYRSNPCHYGYEYLSGSYNETISKKDLFTDYTYQFRYNSSWDWLMPVIQKINGWNIKDNPEIIIDNSVTTYLKVRKPLYKALHSINLSETYNAVVQILAWHSTLSPTPEV